jgi:hypothetical protein
MCVMPRHLLGIMTNNVADHGFGNAGALQREVAVWRNEWSAISFRSRLPLRPTPPDSSLARQGTTRPATTGNS